MVMCCLVVFGGAAWSLWNGEWVVATLFFLVAALYFYIHRHGPDTHHIVVYSKGIQIDQTFMLWEQFTGYWFVWDEMQQVSVINLQLDKSGDQKIPLQMGHCTPDQLREVFAQVGLEELMDHKEGVVDLWIRALKL